MTAALGQFEQAFREAWDSGDFQAAATYALEVYGPEVLGFLVARLRSSSDGEESFSMFAEDLWRGLPSFGFRCSVRTWVYVLARNAANRFATAPHQRAERNLSMPIRSSVSALTQAQRSEVPLHQRTDIKNRVHALRGQLPAEDQTLLILHVDRGLSFRELAIVMHEQGETLSDEDLMGEMARLRQRFARVKVVLRELAVAEGLLEGD
jgi:RNA polymerase sigma-70 factor (ECF subfamily)